MDIFYLFNSGFAIELCGDALIMDYYKKNLSKAWRMPVDRPPAGYRAAYVLASHAHGDHYNPAIFDWLSERADIHYILSDDIKPAKRFIKTGQTGQAGQAGQSGQSMQAGQTGQTGQAGQSMQTGQSMQAGQAGGDDQKQHTLDFIGEGGRLRIGTLDIRAYGSTDAGVSFHIVAEDGTSIFHAGDLNYWHWKDESTESEVREAYGMFAGALEKIKNGVGKIDVAFFPVDPRLGSDYYRGAVMFCETMKPEYLVPMHFSSEFNPPRAFFDELAAHTKVLKPGPGPGKVLY
ncbi:MAG: MBL fold metallo-hydrolase [Oscillospiraceae bacterium]|nr:MBL fold metallo-hydrolase [Oscillospiraceae bacterium]